MEVFKNPDRNTWPALLRRAKKEVATQRSSIQNILHEVRQNGDQALAHFTEKFDRTTVKDLKVSEEELQRSGEGLSQDLKDAIGIATQNITKFHKNQLFDYQRVETFPGVWCWQKSVAIQRIGFYVPGGTAPLFSSVLMLAIPAALAGCSQIIMCSPPNEFGNIPEVILYTARISGVTEIYKVGGAQAIGAMAYGTESIETVNKIFGPGNLYVTTAKQIVAQEGIAIDLPAGPSELAVVADASANPAFVAADLLSQCEHGPDSQVILVSNDKEVVSNVLLEINKQIIELPRAEIAKAAISNSRAIVTKDLNEAMLIINAYAPEHLILAVDNPEQLANQVINAGSVFLGHFTPESAGDYASGTNHTLPTNGAASAYSGVSVDSFVKKITFQAITEQGLQKLAPTIETMAEAEMLIAHKRAVSIRYRTL